MNIISASLMRASGFAAGTVLLLASPLIASAGTQTYAAPGTYTFTVPAHVNTLTVEVWGAGAGGQGCGVPVAWTPVCLGGGDGGNSSFGNVIAYGGHGAGGNITGTGIAGGRATGGDINRTGEAGNWNGTNCSGKGGGNGLNPANTRSAKFPGGGGDGFCFGWGASGGGGGGYAKKTYGAYQFTSGYKTITVAVGKGGAGSAAQPKGANGEVKITWSNY